MNVESVYIPVGTEKLHCLKWGRGKRLLLAFHGYGDDAGIFSPLQGLLDDVYTILSIDLPHHGKSKWPDDVLLETVDLVGFVETLKSTYNVGKVSLIGYSLGGRVCLSIIEKIPESIDKVVLMATDGLTINLYYYFFMQTFIGKKLFRGMLQKPGFYLKAMGWLRKMNFVDPSRYKFAMHFLQTEENRNFLMKVWPGMSDLVPSPSKLKSVIRKHHIPVSIFMGAHDKIISLSQVKKFSRGLGSVQLHILEKGHRVFDHENAQQIAAHLV